MLLIPSSVHAEDTGKILVSSAVILLGAGAITASALWLASDNDCKNHDAQGVCTEGYQMSSTDKAFAVSSMVAGGVVVFSGIWVLLDSGLCVDCTDKQTQRASPGPVTPSVAFSSKGAQLNLRIDM